MQLWHPTADHLGLLQADASLEQTTCFLLYAALLQEGSRDFRLKKR